MKNFYLTFLLVLVLSVTELTSQNAFWDYSTYGGHVSALQVDGNTIWAATQGGLAQIDRTTLSFEVCHRGNSILPSHRVTHLAKDRQGVVYARTDQRMVTIKGRAMDWLRDDVEGIPAPDVLGGVWVAGADGIWKEEDNSWTKVADLPESLGWHILTDFVIDPFNDDLWVTAWTFGAFRVHRLKGETWESFGYENSVLPFESPGNNKLQFDQRGDLWVTTQSGLYKFDGHSWQEEFISHGLAPDFSCSAIFFDEEKRLWVACNDGWNRPARLFVKGLDQWVEYPLQDSIKWINDIKTVEQEVWLATEGQGIYLHKEGQSWQGFFPSNSLLSSNWILSLNWDEAESKLWVGTQNNANQQGQLYHVENGQLVPVAIPNITYPRQIIRQPDGPLWVLAGEGPFIQNGENWLPFRSGTGRIQNEYIEGISFDYGGKLWMIHDDELVIREENNQYRYLSRADMKVNAAINQLFHHPLKDEAWVSSIRSFSHFNGVRWNSSEEVLGERVAMYDAVADSDGVVWLATDKGLLKYENLKYEWIKNSSVEGKIFKYLAIRQDGDLWLSTGRELWRFVEDSSFPWQEQQDAPIAGKIEYLEVDGSNRLWFASDGLGVRGDELLPWTEAHEIQLGRTLAFGESLIYPNPLSEGEYLNILLKDMEFDQMRIIDLKGRIVLNESLDQATDFTSILMRFGSPRRHTYGPGMYILQLFEGGRVIATEKILFVD